MHLLYRQVELQVMQPEHKRRQKKRKSFREKVSLSRQKSIFACPSLPLESIDFARHEIKYQYRIRLNRIRGLYLFFKSQTVIQFLLILQKPKCFQIAM